MKERPLIYLSLLLSAASLIYAAWTQSNAAMAAHAVREREAELVRHWTPRMQAIYRDMLADTSRIPKNPTTLEELFDPLVTLFEQVGEPSSTNKTMKK